MRTPLASVDTPASAASCQFPSAARQPTRDVAARSVLMRVSAAVRAVLAAGLLAALTSSVARRAGHTRRSRRRRPSLATRRRGTDAAPVPPDPRVGAVFLGGSRCTPAAASVLRLAGGDLILTAAHCVADGVDATFVAGLHDDCSADDDVWQVDAVYLDPRWIQNQDPLADFAIARVSRDAAARWRRRRRWPRRSGRSPKPGTDRHRHRLRAGRRRRTDRLPGTATADAPSGFPSLRVRRVGRRPVGAPWIDGSTVTGVIGGLDGGGCETKASRTRRRSTTPSTQLLRRAEAGGPADDAPTVFDDDC